MTDSGNESETSLRILAGLGTAVIVFDASGEPLSLNPSAEQMLGHGLASARKHGSGRFFERCPSLAELVMRVLREQRQLVLNGITIEAPPGKGASIKADCSAAPIELGTQAGVLLELVDVTRREKIVRENTLLDQHGVSRTMVRQLAHEIKNPIGGLRGAAQLLERRLPDEALREYTGVIISEADRLAALVDAMLGPLKPVRKSDNSIHELIEHVIRLLGAEAGSAVTLERDYDPSLPNMMLDRDQIIQALINLGRNAMQAIDGNGRIIFRTRAMTRFTIGNMTHRLVASIEVEDNGNGVAESISEQIFYPLVSGGKGSGLGLPMAQDLVHRHDGLIEFRSQPGQTVFQMLLPIYGAESDLAGRESVAGHPRRQHA